MSDFTGKVIKIYLNTNTGYVCQTGPFLGFEDDFIKIKNPFTRTINYISKYYIRYIEIVKDIDEEDDLGFTK